MKISPIKRIEVFFVRLMYSLIKLLPQKAAIADGIARNIQKLRDSWSAMMKIIVPIVVVIIIKKFEVDVAAY